MKLLHTSDWHIGKKLENFSRLPEQREVLDEICQIADEQDVDAILVVGDVFDNFTPTTEAIELLYKTLHRLSNYGNRLICVIAGNHDSPNLIKSADPLALQCGILLIGAPLDVVGKFETEKGIKLLKSEKGFVEISMPKYNYPLRILHTPYANETRLRTCFDKDDKENELQNILSEHWQHLAEQHCNIEGVNILVSHLLVVNNADEEIQEPDEEKPILYIGGAQAILSSNIPKQIQYFALGHLHRHQYVNNSENKIVYCGSPLAYSFAEVEQDKFVDIININPNTKPEVNQIKINSGKKLIRKLFDGPNEAVEWLKKNQNTLVELSIKTDAFLTAEERRSIEKCHDGIISVIPIVASDNETFENTSTLDLSESMETLFDQFFKAKNMGIAPSEEQVNLFKEILATEQ
ncbi:MAG: exonuclease SbcCD subunit D [Bacteroidales bacterium]